MTLYSCNMVASLTLRNGESDASANPQSLRAEFWGTANVSALYKFIHIHSRSIVFSVSYTSKYLFPGGRR
jgi:hypothetical protein